MVVCNRVARTTPYLCTVENKKAKIWNTFIIITNIIITNLIITNIIITNIITTNIIMVKA